MKVELEADEVWSLLSLVVDNVLEDVDFSDEDRAAIKLWRSEEMRLGSEPMRVLLQKINHDLEKAMKQKERSPIRRPDWR